MYQKFAHKGVRCDSTHGTNANDFSLTTILVIDEFGQGFPSAWCLSSHEDFTTMTIFLKEIKKTCGVVNANLFMSDMAPQFYNAWVAVMGDLRPIKLIRTWHVDKAWKEELRKKLETFLLKPKCTKCFESYYGNRKKTRLRTVWKLFVTDLSPLQSVNNSTSNSTKNGNPKKNSGPIASEKAFKLTPICMWRLFTEFSREYTSTEK